MPRKELNCPSCGEHVVTRYSKQKYCSLCAIIRDNNWGMRPRTCQDCGDEYWPIRNSHKLCSNCFFDTKPHSSYPECSRCGQKHRTPPGVSGICLRCVQSSSTARRQYVDSLRHITLKRRRDNGL